MNSSRWVNRCVSVSLGLLSGDLLSIKTEEAQESKQCF